MATANQGLSSPSIQEPEAKLIVPMDMLILFGIMVLGVIAWILPQRLWLGMANAMAAAGEKVMPGKARETLKRINGLLGGQAVEMTAEEIRRELAVGYIMENLQLLRCHRPGGWRPPMELNGKSHLDAALEKGRGAILLFSFTTHGSLISKMALGGAGYRVTHLSHPRHGFSDSRFGMAVLNPIRTNIEARFLGERAVMTPANPVAALRRLRRRLDEGCVVSFTAREIARRPQETPFLGGAIRLALGAVDLACVSGAPLLPAFTIRHEDGVCRTVIEAPLDVPKNLSRKEARKKMLNAYAASAEVHIRRHPGQWRGWRFMT